MQVSKYWTSGRVQECEQGLDLLQIGLIRKSLLCNLGKFKRFVIQVERVEKRPLEMIDELMNEIELIGTIKRGEVREPRIRKLGEPAAIRAVEGLPEVQVEAVGPVTNAELDCLIAELS